MTAFELELQRIDTPALAMTYALVPWDSEVFGVPVGQIAGIEVRRLAEAGADFAGFEAWRDEAGIQLVACRLEHCRLAESMLLESRGYRFVEMVCSPRLSGLQAASLPPADIDLVEATAADVPALEAIAANAFVTGRYRLDWRLDPAFNAERYRFWVRSSFENPHQATLIGLLDGRPAGFFIVERTHPDRYYWHLTAVAPGFQGQGIGKRLWRAVLSRHQREGVERVETTISLHNTAVLNLYSRLGFSFAPPHMTFHWLRGERLRASGGGDGW